MNFKKFFKTNNGALPPILYVIPVVIWLLGGATYLAKNALQNESVQNKIKAVTMAVDLQEDINYISTKTKASEIFSLSKKEIQKEEKNENFLLAKVKKKLDKSVYSKSVGAYDDTLIGYDKDLSPTLSDTPNELQVVGEQTKTSKDSTAIDEVNYVMDKIKKDRKSKYHLLEEQRKERLKAAKADNRKKRLDLDESTIAIEAAAYREGAAVTQQQFARLHGAPINEAHDDQKKKKKKSQNGFSFATTTGQIDDLKMNQQEKRELKSSEDAITSLPTIDPLVNHKNSLKAVIDQKAKFRSGDKIQLRILENNFYHDVPIYKNTTLYGICTISENRLFINITSINLDDRILPVALTVYDMDGMAGIYIDGANDSVTKDVINQGLSDAANLGLGSTIGNLSIKLGRKANSRAAVHIPTGYPVLLINNNIQNKIHNKK